MKEQKIDWFGKSRIEIEIATSEMKHDSERIYHCMIKYPSQMNSTRFKILNVLRSASGPTSCSKWKKIGKKIEKKWKNIGKNRCSNT